MWFQHISTAKMGISWTNMLMEKHCGFKHQNRNCRQPTSGILPSNNGTHLVFLVPSIDRISPEKMWISPSKNMESLITSAHLGLWSKTCVSFSIKKNIQRWGDIHIVHEKMRWPNGNLDISWPSKTGGLPGLIYQVFHEPKIGISPAKDWDDGKQHQGLDDGTVFAGEKVDFFMPICLVWDINT